MFEIVCNYISCESDNVSGDHMQLSILINNNMFGIVQKCYKLPHYCQKAGGIYIIWVSIYCSP